MPKKAILLVKIDPHYDFIAVKQALLAADIQVDEFHLYDDNIENRDFSQYAVIDLRNCRGFQEDQSRFQQSVIQLEKAAREHHSTFVIPHDLRAFFGAKGVYLNHLAEAGIAINPTVFLSPDAPFDVVAQVKNKTHGVILKPSTGARAWNIYRIQADLSHQDAFLLTHATQQKGNAEHEVRTAQMNAAQLTAFFQNYRDTAQDTILVQDFIVSREYCVVFLGGEFSHVIEKVAHQASENKGLGIRHDLFGATMRYFKNPPAELIQFAQNIIQKHPAIFKRQDLPYFRIDIFENLDLKVANQPLEQRLSLNEVEVMTVHLYLEESNTIDSYVAAMSRLFNATPPTLSIEK
ncbi:MAG: hypothetical protein K2P98_06655 [Neisseriaceae bacterium]|nr:hypothetical protein [Neisseriaceae bacterium]